MTDQPRRRENSIRAQPDRLRERYAVAVEHEVAQDAADSAYSPPNHLVGRLDACRDGSCDHHHASPRSDDPQRQAERRVRLALEELRAAIGALPADHSLRQQFEAGELYAPWRLRAHALLFRIARERAEWQSLTIAMAWTNA